MTLEQLTKTQIVLLTLFVSFVTSIATGIVTVTLMDQAPTDVTRTINRVVERTVEKVVPGETRVIERIKETGPVESDLVVTAVSKARKALVNIKVGGNVQGGFLITADGLIVTRSGDLVASTTYPIDVLEMQDRATSTSYLAEVMQIDIQNKLALLSIKSPEVKPATGLSSIFATPSQKFDYLPLGAGKPGLGERVIALGVDNEMGVFVRLGNVTSLRSVSASSTPVIITTITGAEELFAMPVIDLSANLLGVYLQDGLVTPEGTLGKIFKLANQGDSTSQTATVILTGQ